MKRLYITILALTALFISQYVYAQYPILRLWEGKAPNEKNVSKKSKADKANPQTEHVPALEVFLPVKKIATGQGVLICPGGGYRGLAYEWEGVQTAKLLNAMGIAAFVLKYRLPNAETLFNPHQVPLMDAKRAMRLIRQNAQSWNVKEEQVGVMGFSAGGHLAASLATQYHAEEKPADAIDKRSAKPDFLVLIYPVITMDTAHTHMGSRRSLIGENPSEALVQQYSAELHVTQDTPPTFLVHSSDDEPVSAMNSVLFYQALLQNKVDTEMHIYPFGSHGYSLGTHKGYLETWPQNLKYWLRRMENLK